MRFGKWLATSAMLVSASGALAANLSVLSGSQYSEPSQILSTINTLIQNINAGTSGLIAQTQSPTGNQPGNCGAGSGGQVGLCGNVPGNGNFTNEQQLATLTTAPGILSANGQALRARCLGTFGPNNNSKQMRLIASQGTTTPALGGVAVPATQTGAVMSTVASNVNGGAFELELLLTYNTGTTATMMGRGSTPALVANSAAFGSLATPIVATTTQGVNAFTFANAITFNCDYVGPTSGLNSAADVTVSEMSVEQIK